jgi:hypothetical protein
MEDELTYVMHMFCVFNVISSHCIVSINNKPINYMTVEPLLGLYWDVNLATCCGCLTSTRLYIRKQQERQCTYNVTLGRVHKNTPAVKKLNVLHISLHVYMCGCTGEGFCACSCVVLLMEHAISRHIVICDLWLHHIFRHYLVTQFSEKVIGHK